MKHVYFIKPIGMDGPVKIGCSGDPIARLKQLMAWSPFPLEIVAAFPADNDMESSLQGMFEDSLSHGEWFNPTPRLAEVIEHVRAGRDVAVIFGYELSLGKSAMRVASGIKSGLTRRINVAEKRRERAGLAVVRPEFIRQAIAEYSGTDKPAPTTEHHALADLYIRQLRAA